jgi:transposase-like protein
VRVHAVQNVRRGTLAAKIAEEVQPGTEVFTDSLQSYFGLQASYIHGVIDHSEKYVEGKIHTNGLENFWSLLKRSIKGTYVSVQPFHLFRYLDEQTFRFNNRKDNDGWRFIEVVKALAGKRLTYRELIGSDLPQTSPA